jgi:type IV pilus assembly protein PilY1
MSYINIHSNYINLFAVTLLMVFSHSASADTIANKPLYLENDNAIEPNIMFTIDDSGSMSDTYLSADNKEPSDWKYYSASYNKLYYDPTITYRPWIKADGTEYSTSTEYPNGDNRPKSRSSCTYLTDRWGDKYDFNCYYYDKSNKLILIEPGTDQYTGGASRSDCKNKPSCTFAEEQKNFANWYKYYSTRLRAAKSGIGRAFYSLNDKIRVGYGRINAGDQIQIDGVDTSTIEAGVRKFDSATRSAFFTWLYARTADGSTPLRRALDDVGQYFSRPKDASSPWADTPGGTSAGEFKSCRQSYHILMTDGYWNYGEASTSAARADVDSVDGEYITNDMGGTKIKYQAISPYKGSNNNTLADIAAYYWKRDLQGDIKNKVPPSSDDPAYWQHMVNFTVSFGVDGELPFNSTTLANLTSGAQQWPYIEDDEYTKDIAKKVDDLWHAAINSRGGYYNAANPQAFVDALIDAFAQVQARTGSSSAMVSNTARLGTSSRIYQASFSSGDWSGELTAYPLNSSDGSLGTAVWQASKKLPAASARNIYTRTTGPAKTVLFSWDKLDSSQQAALNKNAAGTTDSNGALRLAWVRGDQSKELNQPNGLFRTRTSLLGDIVNSSPAMVSNQDYGVGDASFVTSKGNRPPMLYVGANDGMLHAFKEADGVEQFAYIPAETVSKLNKLTDKEYAKSHQYLVDGSPRVSDAKLNGKWATVLLGSTGAGGKSVFALDVTDPTQFGTSSVLWEFTSADMGYTIPQPTMGQLADDSWVALIPNGYDSTEQEGKLVVLDLEDGSPVNVLHTNASLSGKLNGLSTPVPVDLDGDRKTDLLYAGDLLGNLWRFDVRSSDSKNWSTRLIFTACVDATCSTSNRQPITARPMVIAHPNGGVMVLFATGSYFTNEDRSSIQLQALYGVWDKLEASPTLIAKSDLVQQSIQAEVSATSTRVISNNEVNYGSKRGWYLNLLTPGLSTGVGERVITDIQLREDQLVVTSMLPSTDPCDYGGKSWLLELAPLTGSRLSYPVFDINNDGKIDNSDNQTVTIDGKSVTLPASGKGFDEILTKSAFVEKIDGTTEIKYASGSSGSIKQTLEIISPNAKGRQSWRQLR